MLIVNADDWGRDRETTQRTLTCVAGGAVSSVSAMVFMEDSDRAASIAREQGVDAGLHLNLTTPFSAPGVSTRLSEHQQCLSQYLQRRRLAQAVFHPGLVRSFEYVVNTQLNEFIRLYGTEPKRIDGHHHMHLCSNVLLSGLLPSGTVVRRNFSFQRGEKSMFNLLYRRAIDGMLRRRHQLTDYFFCIQPLDPSGRLQKIFSLANRFTVELETHPVNPDEYEFLAGGEIFRWTGELQIAPRYIVPQGIN